jgi:cysteine-rich repeat protein
MFKLRLFLAPALVLAIGGATACLGLDRSTGQIEQGDDEEGCTFTQGYWKNHPEAWPVTSLSLGVTVYTQEELLAIFDEPVAGNGLIALSHQLIAAKLNVANGAPDDDIADAIADADALIGDLVTPPIGDGYLDPSVTSELNDTLEEFNSVGPEDCEPEEPVCGDGELDDGEECDDGNNTDGDGCSATCTIEEPPPPEPFCGDGELDEGEECDDGNNTDGDGCSEECDIEGPEPVCGNGIVEPGEQCDDGNTDDNDSCNNACMIITG